jgi:hypothetical protein
MRKNKGYVKDMRKTWHKKEPHNSCAKGENLTLEQYIDSISKFLDSRVETCKKEYEKISHKTTLVGEDLRKYCRDWMLWEVKFDNHCNLIPLDKALEMIEEERRRIIGRRLYDKFDGYQKRIVNKDNQKFVYNDSNGRYNKNTIRIPSLKRSDATWKRFYELFSFLKGKKTYRGIKLKKID